MATVKLFNHHFRTQFLLLLTIEIGVLFYSAFLGQYFRFGEIIWQPTDEDLVNFPLRAGAFAFVILMSMVAMGQYQTPPLQGKFLLPGILTRVLISMILGGLGLFVLYYLIPELLLGRGLLAYSLICAFVGVVLTRLVFYHTVDTRLLRRKILILGTGKVVEGMFDGVHPTRALTPPNASYSIHGFVAFANEEPIVPEQFIVKPGNSLADYCQAYDIEEIVLAISDRRKKLPVDDLLNCKLSNVNVIDLVSFWERELGMVRIDMLNPSWMIFTDGCKRGGFDQFIRRLFDFAASSLILAMMFPILILTALAIFIESGFKGPIFYSQERVGLNGKTFKLLKFRSMITNAEKDGAQWAAANDTRITAVGKFIRKTRIDELPQIINIFKGDMSIVGPRPERPEFVEKLDKSIPFFSTRHRVKPGLAGWAQLKYPYGASEDDAYNKLQYDLYYVKNHSFLMDLFVLLQTVEVILLGKGAR